MIGVAFQTARKACVSSFWPDPAWIDQSGARVLSENESPECPGDVQGPTHQGTLVMVTIKPKTRNHFLSLGRKEALLHSVAGFKSQ